MRDLFTFWKRQYSAVDTSDALPPTQVVIGDACRADDAVSRGRKNSFLPGGRRMSLDQGIPPIIDSFFYQRKTGEKTRQPKRVFILMASALLAIVTAICIYIIQPYFAIFKWKLKFEEGGEIYNLWAKPPVDLYVRVYLFNVTNREAFLSGTDKKLQLQEVGPYVYKELMSHENITFNDNGTLSTNPRHPLVWQEHMSAGNSEDDILILPNIALLSIAQVGADSNFFVKMTVNVLIEQTKNEPLVTMTAKQFMFGYESSITTLGNQFLPNWIPFEKVGLIDRMYDFNGDYETFFTGQQAPQKSGLYDTYRGSQNLRQWEGDYCSNVTGASDGTKFESFLEPNDTVKFFRKSLCRPIQMVRDLNGDSEQSGLQSSKYIFEKNALDNGLYEEKNKCYCREGKCLPAGLIDVTDCYYGFPIALSYPHFMDADPALSERIEGLTPNYTEHHSFFHIQPTSGLPLKCSMKFQINLRLRDLAGMVYAEEFTDMNVPLLWFDIVMFELPQELRNRFHLYLNVLPVVDNLCFYGLFISGVALLIFAISKVSFNISSSMSSPHHISKKYGGPGNQYRSNVYMPCEEKLIPGKDTSCYLSEKPGTEMMEIDLKSVSYELENELPLIEDNESDATSSESGGGSSEETAETPVGDSIKVTENDAFESSGYRPTAPPAALVRGREKRTFSWSIEPEMHPDLLEVFRENGRPLLHGEGEEELTSSTENLKEIGGIDSRRGSRFN